MRPTAATRLSHLDGAQRLPSSLLPHRTQRRPAVRQSSQIGEQGEPSSSTARLIDASRRRLLVAGAAMGPCWCCQQVLAGSEEEEGPGSPAWGYQRLSDWPRTCRMSSLQSPIDIPARSHSRPADASSITNVSFDYRDDAGPVTVVNPGHGTMQVKVAAGSRCQVGDQELELLQYHFHAPSEHALDGQRVAMEAHLVHRDTRTGEFAVLAVLLQPDPSSQQNPALQFALETAHLREFKGPAVIEEPQNLSLISLIPASPLEDSAPQITPDKTLVLMHYTGSLTTPPCSQQVCWYVFLPMVTVAESQVQNFQNFITQTTGMTSNARPLQPLDGRPLEWLQFRVKMPPKSAS
ncbi:hypothetical protein WJX84_008955 [Apatococcus fuscideae]|uniref:carbonic anhydrase n=1 Tax=Apatococcus fuscideae TaxID=2026836 RepID=A0AAW1T0G7_9CHLO